MFCCVQHTARENVAPEEKTPIFATSEVQAFLLYFSAVHTSLIYAMLHVVLLCAGLDKGGHCGRKDGGTDHTALHLRGVNCAVYYF